MQKKAPLKDLLVRGKAIVGWWWSPAGGDVWGEQEQGHEHRRDFAYDDPEAWEEWVERTLTPNAKISGTPVKNNPPPPLTGEQVSLKTQA